MNGGCEQGPHILMFPGAVIGTRPHIIRNNKGNILVPTEELLSSSVAIQVKIRSVKLYMKCVLNLSCRSLQNYSSLASINFEMFEWGFFYKMEGKQRGRGKLE